MYPWFHLVQVFHEVHPSGESESPLRSSDTSSPISYVIMKSGEFDFIWDLLQCYSSCKNGFPKVKSSTHWWSLIYFNFGVDYQHCASFHTIESSFAGNDQFVNSRTESSSGGFILRHVFSVALYSTLHTSEFSKIQSLWNSIFLQYVSHIIKTHRHCKVGRRDVV